MNYEEKYNEILEWARKNKARLNGVPIEEVLPELAESEDERIRKWAANYIHRGVFSEEEHPMALKAIEWLEKQKEQKPAEWSEEDEKTIDDAYCWLCEYAGSLIQRNYGKSSMLYGIANKLKSLRPSWKPSEDELAKKHFDGYCMGREDTMREMKDFIESHFNTNKAREGEDLTDLYRKEYAQPLCLRNGGVCTNPMRDCINCIPTLERFNTSSGTSTLKAEG